MRELVIGQAMTGCLARAGLSSSSADRARCGARDRGDEARACVGQPEPAWLKHVTHEKKASESKSSDDVVKGCIVCG
jgi:hypothetical protein